MHSVIGKLICVFSLLAGCMKHIQPNTDAEKQKELDKEIFYLNIERPEPAERLDADVKNLNDEVKQKADEGNNIYDCT